MTIKVPTQLWAKTLRRAEETDREFPWIRQVDFYLDAAVEYSDEWTAIDLAAAEAAGRARH